MPSGTKKSRVLTLGLGAMSAVLLGCAGWALWSSWIEHRQLAIETDSVWRSWLGRNHAVALLSAGLLLAIGALNAVALTSRRRSENAILGNTRYRIAVSEARFRDAIESMDEGFLLWDAEGRLLLWNQRLAEILPKSAPALRPGISFETYLRNVAIRLLPDAGPGETTAWVADWLQRRAHPGQPWRFVADSGRHVELVERRTGDGGLVSIYRDVTEQVVASQRAADAEAMLRDGIESMDDGFMLHDRNQRLVLWNTRYAQLMPHVAPLMRVGALWIEMLEQALIRGLPHLDAEQRGRWIADRFAARARGEAVEFKAGGKVIRVADRRMSDGGYVIVARDVTDEKNLLERISASETRLRDGLEAMSEGIALWDAEDRLVTWNRRYLELLPHAAPLLRVGMTLRQAVEETHRILHPEWSPESLTAFVEERLARRRMLGHPLLITTPASRILEVVDHAMSSGGHISIFRDVTDARHAADQLAASEALFRDGLESIGEGVVLYDSQRRVQTWNSRYLEMFPEARGLLRPGLALEEFLHAIYPRTYSASSAAQIAAMVEDRMRQMDTLGKPFERRLDDGRIYEVTDRPTSAGGILSIHRDVTTLVRSHEALERALASEREMNTRQRRFISIASHEFRTPLAVIDGAAQRIAARLPVKEPDVVKRLDRIRSAVLRMTGIIERTLSSARLDEGRIELNPQALDLGDLLHELCDRQRQINPQFEIDLSLPARRVVIAADRDLLDQIFTNLLSNAVKYSGAARRIDVSLADGDRAIRVGVRDHGVGVAADEVASLFTRYFRARTAHGISGTGIGLHLVKELVVLHGGRVDVVSELGKGSIFLVDLPKDLTTDAAREDEAAE